MRASAAEVELRADARWRQQRAQQIEEGQREAGAAADEVDRQLRALGASSVQVALGLAAQRERALERQAASRTLLRQLLGDRPLEAIAEAHRQVLLQLAIVGAQREDPDLLLRQLDPVGLQRLQAEADERRGHLGHAREALQRLDGRLNGRPPHEELAGIEEDLQETCDRLRRCQRYVEVLRLAGDMLLEAHRRTIVPGKALLEERAGRYLRVLSDGAYDRVTVDERTLAPRVWVGGPKGWADVDAQIREIGSGAADQSYLGLRLALIDVLCRDRRPPLFLDDPFLTYDGGRQSAAMRLLRDLSRDGRQIFLLTCRRDYHGYADHLIELAAAPRHDDSAGPGAAKPAVINPAASLPSP
jgi:uncharacterized protein YhaN